MSEKIFVPPLKIQGIKTKLVPLIRENVILDKETIWYEPFMGSGVVGFNVEPERAVFADVNPHIINFYNRIKDGSITRHRRADRAGSNAGGICISRSGREETREWRCRLLL